MPICNIVISDVTGLKYPGFGRAGPDLSGYRAGLFNLGLRAFFRAFQNILIQHYSAYIGPTLYKYASVQLWFVCPIPKIVHIHTSFLCPAPKLYI